ncbi:MAG: hypothetical protein M0R44_05705 [Candidatus Marinimicrobia bacterium]|jgi:hypothetical protein|nr:hypothetical protein [Candidatus Neomarinimicrobiota bacterium]
MKKYLLLITIIALIVGLLDCEKNILEETTGTIPTIENITINYSELNHSLFITAEIDDPQGLGNLDSVVFNLYRIDAITALSGTLFMSGELTDGGPPRDIIIHDGVFSYLIDSTELGSYEGYYRVFIQAYDLDGNVSESSTATELVQTNTRPEIYLLSDQTNFEKWDTLYFYVRVTDLQGYQDIAGVYYGILQPDNAYLTFYMRDDGEIPDDNAEDGVFSAYASKNPESTLQGLYTFYFYAKDFSGAMSDTVTVKITNPGIHITAPSTSVTLHYGNTLRIEWESAYISRVVIEYAFDANLVTPDWVAVDTVAAALGQYDWVVPSLQSSNSCKVRVSDLNKPLRSDVNDNYLVIIP